MLARMIGEQLSQRWRQPVLIDNQHGINGIDGSAMAARAFPDGYTLVMAATAHYVNPSLYRNLPFDPITDFTPVALVAYGANVLVVHPSVPATSTTELIDWARQHPGSLSYASGGYGSPSHVAGELFKAMAGVDITHVPYRGHAAAGRALSEGREVQLMFDATMTAMPHVRAGAWRALALTNSKRARGLPQLETITECGLLEFDVSPAIGVLAPRNTPAEIVNRLSLEITSIVHAPQIAASIERDGGEVAVSTPELFATYIESEIDKWAKLVESAGIPLLDSPMASVNG